MEDVRVIEKVQVCQAAGALFVKNPYSLTRCRSSTYDSTFQENQNIS
jgi:hypothetical protein